MTLAAAGRSKALDRALFVCVSLAIFGNYYVYDCIAPLADLLKSERGFSDTQIGTLNAVYSLPNVVMVLVGGMLVDRIGAARSVALFALVCALGSILCAVAPSFAAMVVGRLVFGLGAESLIVGVTTALGHWFGGKRLGLMLGLNLSIARGGSYAADLSPTWARSVYAEGMQPALFLAAGFAFLSLLAAVAAFLLERSRSRREVPETNAPAPRFAWSDALRFDRSYWYLVGLCVAIYSVLFPFRSTFAIEYFQHAHGLTREAAGALNGWVFLAAIVATPFFGWLFDRAGRRTSALLGGSLLLLPVFPILAWTSWDPWISNVLLGLAFSLVPAVLWPCVALLVEGKRLGTAYGLMTMIQNVGLAGFNLAAGALNDAGSAGSAHPDGYIGMLLLFASSSMVAVLFAAVLHRRARIAATLRI
jgi:MFS family permease